jgi:hypothetical protein
MPAISASVKGDIVETPVLLDVVVVVDMSGCMDLARCRRGGGLRGISIRLSWCM